MTKCQFDEDLKKHQIYMNELKSKPTFKKKFISLLPKGHRSEEHKWKYYGVDREYPN